MHASLSGRRVRVQFALDLVDELEVEGEEAAQVGHDHQEVLAAVGGGGGRGGPMPTGGFWGGGGGASASRSSSSTRASRSAISPRRATRLSRVGPSPTRSQINRRTSASLLTGSKRAGVRAYSRSASSPCSVSE